MQKIVVGNLVGLEETKICVDEKGEVNAYPRQELDVSLDWVFDHMGKRIMCQLQDGVVTQVRAWS